MQRKVLIKHPDLGGRPKTFDVTAVTLGELKTELSSLNWNNIEIMDRANHCQLQDDDAILHEKDFILFCYPQRVTNG